MVKTGCRDAPCHSPEELKRRLKEPGISLEELDMIIERELKALAAAGGKRGRARQ